MVERGSTVKYYENIVKLIEAYFKALYFSHHASKLPEKNLRSFICFHFKREVIAEESWSRFLLAYRIMPKCKYLSCSVNAKQTIFLHDSNARHAIIGT